MDDEATIPSYRPGECTLQREAHVWRIPLGWKESELRAGNALLSNAERLRSERFFFPDDRRRYVAAHAGLRAILASYVSAHPEALEFHTGPNGKPLLSAPNGDLCFNLSHAGEMGLVGVTRAGDIGVDIEELRRIEGVSDLVERFFAPSEAKLFRSLNASEKPGAFLNLWTRKEALLKATGEGIASSLNRVEVTFLETQQAEILKGHSVLGNLRNWTLIAAEFSGYKAAMAVRAPGVAIRRFIFSIESFSPWFTTMASYAA